MKEGLTELVFILDKSGSMRGLERDTIKGFNDMVKKQKTENGDANITTVLFDDQYAMIHDSVPIRNLKPLTEKEYYVCGCTALLDAIGKTICYVENKQKKLPKKMKAEKVIFVITTDGLENSSVEYSYKAIEKMINTKKCEFGWEFLFLGANIDAVAEAQKFGINQDRSVTFKNDGKGIAINYRAISHAITSMRSVDCMSEVDGTWKMEIEQNFQENTI